MPIRTHLQSKGVNETVEEIQLSQNIHMSQNQESSDMTNATEGETNRAINDEGEGPSNLARADEEEETNVRQDYGQIVDSHISSNWLDTHTSAYQKLLPRIPLCRLYPNPAIRTNHDHVDSLIESIDKKDYQPTMASFIISESFSGQDPIPIDRRKASGFDLPLGAEFDDILETIPEWRHMVEKMWVVWDGNHRLFGWSDWSRGVRDRDLIPKVVVR